MASILEQLAGDDAALLMYVADELPASDRAEIERRLSGEPGLRARLEALRHSHETIGAAMRELDAAVVLPGSEPAAVRQVSRAMRQWQARRLVEAAHPRSPRRELRFPWWSYPLAAAAALTFAFAVWYQVSDPAAVNDQVATPTTEVERDLGIATATPFETPQFAIAEPLLEDPNDLSELEQELIAVRELRDWLQ